MEIKARIPGTIVAINVKPGDTVAFICNDPTRVANSFDFMPVLVDEMNRLGVKDEDMKIVFALGTHRAMTHEEMVEGVGENVASRLKMYNSICTNDDDFEYFGTTSRGTPVHIHKELCNVDHVILTGTIGHHYFSGYGGGRKAILPGCAAMETVRVNHSFMLDENAALGRTTGNPVREEIVAVSPPQDRMANRTGPLRVFIFGGSLGAQVFNDNMPAVFAAIPQEQRPIIVHQTGKDRDAPVREAYEKLGVKAEVVPFINDMAAQYEDCDVVICRAGATSVSELCAAGVASILVPFVAKTTAHQTGNAKYMVERHAAIMVPQPEFTVERMAELISGLTRDHLLELAKNARATARPQAAEAVANLIVETVARRTGAQDAK